MAIIFKELAQNGVRREWFLTEMAVRAAPFALLIPTRLSGSRPVLFLVDTGAARSAISNRAAAEVTRVRTEDVIRLKGVSGNVNNMFTADKLVLQFAGYNQRNRDMLAIDLDQVSQSAGTEVSGIIGFPLLTIFSSLTIDYRDGLVKFDYQQNGDSATHSGARP
ncbi:MAG: aspartyl protease family protein [Bryobacteraceae bacterium]